MKRFVIERNLPGVHNLAPGELSDAAAKSNAAIAGFGGRLTWEHSYVVNDKTFCIYIADNEALVYEHARRSGFPATKVIEITKMIDPTTAAS